MRYSIFLNYKYLQKNELGKINFPLGKFGFWNHWELCVYNKICDLGKYLYVKCI